MIQFNRVSPQILPHYFVDPIFAKALADGPHDKFHHRAHLIAQKTLFVYFQVLVVTVGLFAVLGLRAPQILGEVTFSAEQIVALTNAKRSQNGLSELSSNPLLAQAAGAKASDMFANDYWAHNSPGGKTPWSFINGAGYRYIYAGENLARDFSDPGAVVEAWMNSPTHRANLLDKNFREIGVAVAGGKLGGREGILVVQMFGASVSAPAKVSEVAGNKNTESLPTPAPTVAQVTPPSIVASPTAIPAASPGIELISPVPGEIDKMPTIPQQGQITLVAARQFAIAKGISLGLVIFLFLMFAVEVLVTLKRAHVHLRSGVLAHLALLGFVLFALWYATSGAIL